jgi:hypothetical protein
MDYTFWLGREGATTVSKWRYITNFTKEQYSRYAYAQFRTGNKVLLVNHPIPASDPNVHPTYDHAHCVRKGMWSVLATDRDLTDFWHWVDNYAH